MHNVCPNSQQGIGCLNLCTDALTSQAGKSGRQVGGKSAGTSQDNYGLPCECKMPISQGPNEPLGTSQDLSCFSAPSLILPLPPGPLSASQDPPRTPTQQFASLILDKQQRQKTTAEVG